jgi:general secretion pathway protein K
MPDRRQAGFALLIVLWSLVLLSLILTQVLSAGRSEAQLAGNLRASAVAEAVADGAVQDTIFHLLEPPPQHWPLHGRRHLVVPGGVADVAIENVAGKINPNAADEPLLGAMLTLCGASSTRSAAITQAILAWRAPVSGVDTSAAYRAAGLAYAPPGAPFETSDEIGLVIGMTPALRVCVLPHMSIYQENDTPTLAAADPFVARVLALVAQQSGGASILDTDEGGDPTVTITATAMGRGGARFTRRATVRLVPDARGRPFRILNWQSL